MAPRLQRSRTPAAVVSGRSDAAASSRELSLLEVLAKRYALGTLSGPAVVELAAAAARDAGPQGPCSVRELAALESEIQHSRNLARAVRRVFSGAGFIDQPPLSRVELPISKRAPLEPEGTKVEPTAWPCVLPILELPSCVAPGERALTASTPALRRAAATWCETMSRQGCQVSPDELIPIGLYADAAPFSEHNSVFVVSWIFSSETRPERHVITTLASSHLCSCGCRGQCTLSSLWRALTWSMEHLARGRWPKKQQSGEPWNQEQEEWMAGKTVPRAALLQLRGDWSWFKLCFSFRAWSSKSICWRCDAGVEHSWADFGPTASWRDHRVSHEELVGRASAQLLPGAVSALFDIPGFRAESIAIDLLHTADLGVTSFAAGSLLHEEMREPTRGATNEERLRALNRELAEFYDRHPARSTIAELTPQAIQMSGKSPALKSKAAEARYLVPWLNELASSEEHRTRLSEEHYQTRALCFRALDNFYKSLEGQPWSPDDTRREGVSFLEHYGHLHDLARNLDAGETRVPSRGELCWHIKPKHHLFQHLVEEQVEELGNPRSYWTYTDESLMGVLSQVAAATPDPRGVCEQVMSKLRLLASLAL